MKHLFTPSKFIAGLCIIFLLSFSSKTYATHYMGGDITAVCLGNNQYKVSLTLFYDCNGITSGTAATINLVSPTMGTQSASLNLETGYPLNVTNSCPSASTSCSGGGGNYGVHQYVYSNIISIPAATDWTLSYSICCRNNAATNITNPSASAYLEAQLNTNLTSCNSSPSFVENYPIIYGCVGNTTYMNFNAIDPDGDSLVYSFTNVLSASGTSLTYAAGFSAQAPINGSSSIDASSGSVMILPNVIQTSYIAVKVEEYRNGIKIGETMRDVQVYINNCTNDIPQLTAINGINMTGGNFSFSTSINTPFSLTIDASDADVSAGTQTISPVWNNLPTTATTSNSSATSFMLNWQPTTAGTYYFSLNLEDDNCPIQGKSTYIFEVVVTGTAPPPPITYHTLSDAIAAGASRDVCLTIPNITGTILNFNLIGSLDNGIINSYDYTTGCVNIKGDSIALDTILISVCDSLICDTTELHLAVEAGVWPGDANVDTKVNHFDLLNIGLAYGSMGQARNNASSVWDGYLTPDWLQSTGTVVDYKHVDCNGDGIINAADTNPINMNWGSSYFYSLKGASGVIPLYVDISNTPTTHNAALPIILGNSAFPATDAYGLAFSLNYDTTLIVPNSVYITFDNSWLGIQGTDLLSVQKDFYNNSKTDLAITRHDGNNITGFGQIGMLNFTIQDDIMLRGGNLQFVFSIDNIEMIDNQASPILIDGQSNTLVITSTNTNNQALEREINLFPNPANEQITIEAEKTIIEDIIMMNITGQGVISKSIQKEQRTLKVNELPTGIYTIMIKTNKGILNKKISINH